MSQLSPELNIQKYIGIWHEFARIPFKYEPDCVRATAEYTIIGRNNYQPIMKIVNSCVRSDGSEYARSGLAYKTTHPLVLSVIFDKPYGSDTPANYIVLYTDYTNYSIVLSGVTNVPVPADQQSSLHAWILTRSTTLAKKDIDVINKKLRDAGVDTNRLLVNRGFEISASDPSTNR
jgi:lipocalin